MNRFNRYLLAAVTLLAVNAFIPTAGAQEYKIGVVDLRRIISESPQAKKTTALIENEFSPRDKQLVADQKALVALEERLSKDAAIMNATERENLERDVVNKRRDLKRDQDEFNEDLTFRRNEELAKIQNEVINAVQVVARENDYDLVLTDGIVYVDAKMDISNQVIQYLTEQASN